MLDTIASKFGGTKRSSKWRSVRNKFIESNDECACCGSMKKLQVHHIEPFCIAPERELDTTNLITLCSRCHLFVGHCGWWAAYNSKLKESLEYLRIMLQDRRTCRFGFSRRETWVSKFIKYILRKWYHFN